MIRQWLYASSIELRIWLGRAHHVSYRIALSPANVLRWLSQLGLDSEAISRLNRIVNREHSEVMRLQKVYDKAHESNEQPTLRATLNGWQPNDKGLLDQFSCYGIKTDVGGANK